MYSITNHFTHLNDTPAVHISGFRNIKISHDKTSKFVTFV